MPHCIVISPPSFWGETAVVVPAVVSRGRRRLDRSCPWAPKRRIHLPAVVQARKRRALYAAWCGTVKIVLGATRTLSGGGGGGGLVTAGVLREAGASFPVVLMVEHALVALAGRVDGERGVRAADPGGEADGQCSPVDAIGGERIARATDRGGKADSRRLPVGVGGGRVVSMIAFRRVVASDCWTVVPTRDAVRRCGSGAGVDRRASSSLDENSPNSSFNQSLVLLILAVGKILLVLRAARSYLYRSRRMPGMRYKSFLHSFLWRFPEFFGVSRIYGVVLPVCGFKSRT